MVALVGIRGQDVDLAADRGYRYLTINGNYENIPLAGRRVTDNPPAINMFTDRHTYRQLQIRTSTGGVKVINFFASFVNAEFNNMGEGTAVVIRYPQRHIFDIHIYGANGPNGFLLGSYGNPMWPSNIAGGDRPMTNLSMAFTFYSRGGIGQSQQGSRLLRYRTLEAQNWDMGMNETADVGFTAATASTLFTRNSTLTGMISAGRTTARDLWIAKWLHMLYSQQNMVTLRVTVDFPGPAGDTVLIKVEKYTQGLNEFS